MLKDRVRDALLRCARTDSRTTYRDLADDLDLEPPQTIHQITDALETLMAEDVAAGRPLLATLCVSRSQPELPARGFFLTAQELGLFAGDPESAEAQSFYREELRQALAFYNRS